MSDFYVHRIHRWPDGAFLVEVSEGRDSADPGVLTTRYRNLGEGDAFFNPRNAATAAVRIMKQWQKDDPVKFSDNMVTLSAIGLIGELGVPAEEMSALELFKWAKRQYALMPRCGRCGDPFRSDERYTIYDSYDEEGFCTDYCAETAYLERLKVLQEENLL